MLVLGVCHVARLSTPVLPPNCQACVARSSVSDQAQVRHVNSQQNAAVEQGRLDNVLCSDLLAVLYARPATKKGRASGSEGDKVVFVKVLVQIACTHNHVVTLRYLQVTN